MIPVDARGRARGASRRGRLGVALAIGLGLGIVGVGLSLLPGVLEFDEAAGLGALFAVRGPVPPPPGVAVVSISAESAAAVGQTHELDEWPRELHAALVDRLVEAGAAVVAFDVLFEEPRAGNGDRSLAQSIRNARNVLLFERLEQEESRIGNFERRLLPLPDIKAAALGSAPFILPRVPIRVGQFWTFGRAAADWPSLPVVAVQAYLLDSYERFITLLERAEPGISAAWPRTRADVVAAGNLEELVQGIRNAFRSRPQLADALRSSLARTPPQQAGPLRVLLDLYAGGDSRYLNYYGPARTVQTIPYDQVVNHAPGVDLAGKMVFVGFSETRQPDQQDDFISVFSQPTGINLSGVEVGATAFANLLDGRSLRPLPMPVHLALLMLLGVVCAVALWPRSTRAALLAAPLGAAAYAGLAYWQFVAASVWWPLAVPLLAQLPLATTLVVWRNYRELARQRQRVHMALGYYVPPAVARRLAEQSTGLEADRQLLHGTCLVTDAEQYTALAETLGPEPTAALMNDYYGVLFRVVEEYGGEISDTAGDSMVAVWATAEPDPQARVRAMDAAIAMADRVDAFNRERAATPLPTRIGLESGEVVIGNIGAVQRYEYRAIGDIVNTAARIQGLGAILGTRVLVSGATLTGSALDPPTRDVGTFLLRGKRVPVRIHEPVATAPGWVDESLLAAFAAALAAFRSGAWADARARFEALAGRYAEDGPTRYYAALAAQYEREPPQAWNGVVYVAQK
ncbi:MAG TPA: adenylate/guanylate cyclase domain-containing protein [Gammaproteobacteria bacterium]|nr:adenylate/guanylate cyclase domain-containing protein [Gammaproteobacteria bacterium]